MIDESALYVVVPDSWLDEPNRVWWPFAIRSSWLLHLMIKADASVNPHTHYPRHCMIFWRGRECQLKIRTAVIL